MARPIDSLDSDNWRLVLSFLPEGWDGKARELGALRRSRKVATGELLFRLMMIHLADGCSLRETSARALQAGLADVSDVALLKRLRKCSEWFRWMAVRLVEEQRCVALVQPDWLAGYKVRSVDASVICEPGSTGTDWRLHYSMDLFSLSCEQFLITSPEVGESFVNFNVSEGDLLVADRAYAAFTAMSYVRQQGGDFLLRYRSNGMTLVDGDGARFKVLEHVADMALDAPRQWFLHATTKRPKQRIPIRLCVLRKSPKAAEYARRLAQEKMKRKGRTISRDALDLQRYFVVVTSLVDESVSAQDLLELYRVRWQVELAFKRLKSIMGLGHLPKTDFESARAWLHGKLVVALLVRAIVDRGRLFSPWGYPLSHPATPPEMSLA